MMDFCKKALKRIKLTVLYITRIVFVKNCFDVPFWIKIKANLCGGFLADQYVLYDLEHNDKAEFLSEFDWYRSRYINEPFDFAFNNKVICAEILKQYVRVPENYFIKNKGVILDFAGGIRNVEAVLECVALKQRVFLKPFALGKGNGVHLLAKRHGQFLIDEKPCTQEEILRLLKQKQDYIICEHMRQHTYAEKLYEKTANTIRMITMRNPNTHKFYLTFAVQRIGREATIPVDNGSRGGLVAKIDLASGCLSEARCLHDLEEYAVHPDSKARIKDVEIPGWNEVKDMILQISDHLVYMDFIAWDVLLCQEGACVIEANASSGVNILQLWGGQRQEALGEFFRYYGVIK